MTCPDWLLTKPIAHRGLHGEGKKRPENTMAAFRAAHDAGYAVELDVQRAGDGTVVVFHDPDLERLADADGRVDQMSAAALAATPIMGGDETIPTLKRLTEELPDLPLLVEVKARDPELAPATAAVLDQWDGPFAVQSFWPHHVQWFADNRPDWCRGLVSYTSEKMAAHFIEPVFDPAWMDELSMPDFVAWWVRDLPAPVGRGVGNSKWSDLPVMTWTVRNDEDQARAETHADNMIFEGFLP